MILPSITEAEEDHFEEIENKLKYTKLFFKNKTILKNYYKNLAVFQTQIKILDPSYSLKLKLNFQNKIRALNAIGVWCPCTYRPNQFFRFSIFEHLILPNFQFNSFFFNFRKLAMIKNAINFQN